MQELAQKSKKERIQVLFDRYGKQLYQYAYYQWRIEEDTAWDLVYQSIYKMEEVIDEYSYSTEKKMKAFLFRIFINRMKNRIRDEKTKKNGINEVELTEDKEDKKELQNGESGKVKALQLILDELEDWQRILLLMRAQEFAYSEIARYVGRPEKTLKVYYSRLKKQIASKLELHYHKTETHEK